MELADVRGIARAVLLEIGVSDDALVYEAGESFAANDERPLADVMTARLRHAIEPVSGRREIVRVYRTDGGPLSVVELHDRLDAAPPRDV